MVWHFFYFSVKFSGMVIHSSFSDFVLFLYVHLAHSDSTFDPREIGTIKDRMKRLFPEGTDLEQKLYQTIRQYNEFDHAKLPDLISSTFSHFRDDSESTDLFDDLHAIVNADGQVLAPERDALEKIKAILYQS